MMGAMQKLRQWIQSYVGVLSLEKKAKERHTEILAHVANMCKSVDDLAKERHEDQARLSHERYLALAEMLRQFEQRMMMKHIDQPREFTPPVLDWDTVQAIALHDLEKGP